MWTILLYQIWIKKKKGFQTYKKHIKYWDIRDLKFNERNRNFEIRPIRDSKFRM